METLAVERMMGEREGSGVAAGVVGGWVNLVVGAIEGLRDVGVGLRMGLGVDLGVAWGVGEGARAVVEEFGAFAGLRSRVGVVLCLAEGLRLGAGRGPEGVLEQGLVGVV